jgi:serine O-acetyltransferase
MIGPGAYVNFDVPEKAIVLGNPGKVVSFAGSVGYVNQILQLPISESIV